MSIIVNAIITDAAIEIEDHGMLTLWLHVKHECGSQGFGGYHVKDTLGIWVREIFKVCNVMEWEALKGKIIRVRFDPSGSTIEAIGHAIDDVWFVPAVVFKKRGEA